MKKLLYVASVPAAMAALFFSAGTANAAGVHIDDVQHGVKQPIALSECRADGSTCTIGAGKTIGSTISGNSGVDFGILNASLGGTYQKTYTVTTSCQSPQLKRGQAYVMYPRGDFVFFHDGVGNKGTAFLPTGVFCEVHSDW
ncbi:hypothetical protein [Actinopolyspora mortivallis]|uniref:hypothetical protein n=1 Tax=Actinopolyspora mortivallis TaxID=33906 RepID=UPI000371035B|nr:hypothetical protein [Actinopolyspora mortivallis]